MQTAISEAVQVAASVNEVLLVLGLGSETEAEGKDRVNLTLPLVQQQLLTEVLQAIEGKNINLIIVVVSAGGVDVGDAATNAAAAILYVSNGAIEVPVN
mgnify:CR=1 FL=1